MEGVKTWLSSQAADFFDTGIQKLIPLYDKYLSSGGDYVEKSLKYVRIFIYNNICFLIVCFVNSSPEVTLRRALVYSLEFNIGHENEKYTEEQTVNTEFLGLQLISTYNEKKVDQFVSKLCAVG
jgi:hypothetical protein